MKIYNLAWFFLLLYPFVSPDSDSQQQTTNRLPLANIVFKSTDGGQTWQDISEGLPENFQENAISSDAFFANESGFFWCSGNGLYHSEQTATASFWKKENCPDQNTGITRGQTGQIAYNYSGQCVHKINGTRVWLPMSTNLHEKDLSMVYETPKGLAFTGSDRGIFKSSDSGRTWKQVRTRGASKFQESNGVLMATSRDGILRSTDDGEHWEVVLTEGGIAIDIECIDGGFAAITYNTSSETRRVRATYDGGYTWVAIDAGLPKSLNISSIIQVDNNYYCGHPTGIFKSSDKGKTWQLLFPSIGTKVFNLSRSGNVIYAVSRKQGC